jgi:SAM-dependent MidA family methyltransferase
MHDAEETRETPLSEWIAGKIGREGPASFRDFMDWCLYHPQYGYYMQDRPIIGKEGDFYTSASVGTLMGEMLAAEFAGRFREHRFPVCLIVEWGGGTGRLAGQVLDELAARHPDVYERTQYWIVDKNARHRRLHQSLDGHHAGKWRTMAPEAWFADGAGLPAGTVVFSNELLDAFPVHRVRFDGSRFQEQFVGLDDRGGFAPCWRDIDPGSRLGRWLAEANPAGRIRPGQLLEVNLEAEDWLLHIARRLSDGLVVTVDYGDVEDVLWSPARMAGTLMCYRKHTAHDDPFVHAGEQDITAHVNFSALMRAGEACGLVNLSFETQRDFLLRNGILGRLAEHDGTDPFHPAARRNRAIRQLIVGDRMGDVFKVLIQQKGGRA